MIKYILAIIIVIEIVYILYMKKEGYDYQYSYYNQPYYDKNIFAWGVSPVYKPNMTIRVGEDSEKTNPDYFKNFEYKNYPL